MTDVGCTAFGLAAIYRGGHIHHTVRLARKWNGHAICELLPCLGCGLNETEANRLPYECESPLEWF